MSEDASRDEPRRTSAAQLAYDDQPHVPAQADPSLAAVLERVGRAIAGTGRGEGREAASVEQPCPEAPETR